MLFYTHLVWSLDLRDFLGPHGWLPPAAVQLVEQGSYTWSYWWWFDSAWAQWTVHLAALVVFALLTVGLFTRVVSILAFIAAMSYVGRLQVRLFGLDQINIMLALYLAVGPSGDAFSLDRWLASRRAGGPLPVQLELDGEPGHPPDPGAHVRDLSVRRHGQADRAGAGGTARRCGWPLATWNISRST